MKTGGLKGLLVGLAALSATGCAGFWQPRPVPFAAPDSVLLVQRPIDFPAGTTRVYFQHGGPVTERQLTVWEHHCALAIDHAFDTAVTIEPGPQSITHTQRRRTIGEWGYGVMTYENSFFVTQDARPLYALYCELWTMGGGHDNRAHITPAGLAEVLGDWLSLTTTAEINAVE
ncbi:MAG: hypothetical protein WCY26_04925 [Thiohalobacteraceae bacterium]